jgi:serine/threonine-protein kinase
MAKELSSDSMISHYRIVSKLGEGGMGEVFLAEDTRLRRRVALKVLPEIVAADEDRLLRFEREAFAASALNHPNILTIFEFGVEHTTHFLVSEFVDGESLREQLSRSTMTLTETLEIVIQIASALQAAHGAGIIHRDIKPDNVMIRADGYVKVLDFGLAKLAEPGVLANGSVSDPEAQTRRQLQTQAGIIMGTVAYMSPEQARGLEVDKRTDVWSLGCVLYEMLTRKQPFRGETTADALANIIHREPIPVFPLCQDANPELERIVNKMLSKNRDERYANANVLLADLKQLQKRLEFEAELERSSPPNSKTEARTQVIRSATTEQSGMRNSIAVLPFSNLSADPDNDQTEQPTTTEPSEAYTVVLNSNEHRSGKAGSAESSEPKQSTDSNSPAAAESRGSEPVSSKTSETVPDISCPTTITPGSRRSVLIIGLTVLLLAVATAGYWFFGNRGAGQINSIAVMPFVNASGNADVEYLSDGMTETLISSLSQVPNLAVKSRSTVFHYKGKETSAKKIGEELNVQAVLLGRVVERGEELNLNLELVNTQTQNVIWTGQYNRKHADLVTLQSEIARDVSQKLERKLSGVAEDKLAKKYSANPDAYELYLKGRYHWNRRTVEDDLKGLDYFEKAVKTDPKFALAYVGISDAHIVLGIADAMAGAMSPAATLPPARAAAEKAIELDPDLAEAYASRGHVRWKERDWSGAESDFKRSIQLNPNYSYAHLFYSIFLAFNGRFAEGLIESKRSVELDPYSIPTVANMAYVNYFARRTDEAIASGRRAVAFDNTIPIARQRLGMAYEQKGMLPEAIAEFQAAVIQSNRVQLALTSLAHAYALSGNEGEARKILAELEERSKQQFVSSYLLATVHVALGEKRRALELLEDAYKQNSIDMVQAKTDPKLDPLRDEPRFQELLKKIGFPE